MTTTCQSCGAPLEGEGVGGVCPKCLLDGVEGAGPAVEVEVLAELLPDYEEFSLIGRGGMGFVYRARQKKLNRPVAIKILPFEHATDPEFRERFLREARALASLNHSNIVTIYDVGESEDFVYFVMEYVEGASLAELIRSGDVTPAEGLRLVPQMCDALEFAHAHGVVHRDVKPGNILVDRDGRVKIADFGLAKLLRPESDEPGITMTGATMGTLGYIAPEQQKASQQVDHRADIYSLGVVIYEMLTGELPVGRFEAPSKKVQVDVRLDEVLLRALDAKPECRYQHASEVKRDVEGIGERPPRQAGLRSVLRNPAFWAGIVVLILALGVVVYVGGLSGGPIPDPVPPPIPQRILILGTGVEFESIEEALEKVEAGQTIRITGSGTYEGPVAFVHAHHRGITLESTGGATLKCRSGINILLSVINVSGVTVRGFKLTIEGAGGVPRAPTLIVAGGRISGLVLEDLEFESPVPGKGTGISLERIQVASQETPVLIRRCKFRNLEKGIRLSGFHGRFEGPQPGRGMLVLDNDFISTSHGISVYGAISDTVVAGNTFYRSDQLAVRLQNFYPQTENLLVSNNTMLECGQAFRLFDDGPIDGKEIRLANNLSLDSSDPLDWVIYDCEDPLGNSGLKPGDGRGLQLRWTIDHNFRESSGPPTDALWKPAWIPPGDDDHLAGSIGGVPREDDTAEFLQPVRTSPLATGGAGGDLPSYVGAVPPEGSPRFENWRVPE